MKIRELRKQLEQIEEEHGNIEIVIENYSRLEDMTNVKVNEEYGQGELLAKYAILNFD